METFKYEKERIKERMTEGENHEGTFKEKNFVFVWRNSLMNLSFLEDFTVGSSQTETTSV